MTSGLAIHTKAQTCNQALELIPEEPFEFFEDNGESYNHFYDNYYGMYLGPITIMPTEIGDPLLGADNYWMVSLGAQIQNVARIKDDRNNQQSFQYFHSGASNVSNPTFPDPANPLVILFVGNRPANVCQDPPPSNKKEIENDMEHKSSQLNVFPNPAKDILSIDIQTPSIRGSYQLSVYNYVGQIVHSAEYLDHRIELPIEQLPSGIYIIKVEIQGEEIVSRFIKK